MYEEGGLVYVYLCYGIHWMLNIVTGEKNFSQSVLIRAVEAHSGPGKLTKFLNIDGSLNTENLILSDKLWIEEDNFICNFKATKRVGIDYATDKYTNKLWRFVCI